MIRRRLRRRVRCFIDRTMRIVLFGAPGTGKGTQAALLAERRGVRHISTGAMFRDAIRARTPHGRMAEGYVRRGWLVPDEYARDIAEDALLEIGLDNFVLDGYPRTVVQAEWLSAFLAARDTGIDLVIAMELCINSIIERLSMRRLNRETGEHYHLAFKPPPPDVDPALIVQRLDDRPDAIRSRIEGYWQATRPVVDYYRKQGIIVDVDADGALEDVYARIEDALAPIAAHAKTASKTASAKTATAKTA